MGTSADQLKVMFSTEDDLWSFVREATSAVSLALEYTAGDVWGNIGRFAPTDHGRLAGSFDMAKDGDLSWRIYSNVEYAMAVHEGTGVYGPEGTEIKPKTAQALKFFWKKTGQTMIFKGDLEGPREKARFAAWAEERGMTPVFAWVQGMEPRPYADQAIEATEGRVQEFAERAVREIMGGSAW